MSATSLSLSSYDSIAVTATSQLTISGDATTQPGKAAASAAPNSQTAAVINAVRINAVPLDIASYGAIMSNIDSGWANGGTSPRDAADFEKVMEMIGGTLTQGQGGYFFAINAPGGSLMTAMTPGQLGAYMQSGGTLYKDTLISSNGHSYSLYDLLNQAFAANTRTEQMQLADPATANPNLLTAELLLNQMQTDSAPGGGSQWRSFLSHWNDPDAATTIRTLVLQLGGTGNNSVRLSIVYFPPGLGNGPQAWSAPATTAASPETLQLTA
jgi:hypothetical protein